MMRKFRKKFPRWKTWQTKARSRLSKKRKSPNKTQLRLNKERAAELRTSWSKENLIKCSSYNYISFQFLFFTPLNLKYRCARYRHPFSQFTMRAHNEQRTINSIWLPMFLAWCDSVLATERSKISKVCADNETIMRWNHCNVIYPLSLIPYPLSLIP